jgi:DNA (cytosine-5)-methyltransferase 1
MRVGSLFTGCMGLDLGLEAAGHEIAWCFEEDRACRQLIRHHRPGLLVYPDVRTISPDLPAVDLLAGGFPCQDLSSAGLGVGLDGERSSIWWAFIDAIRLLQPRHVLIENVPGIFTTVGSRPGESAFGSVLADLAEARYVGRWLSLRASDFGACHRRERVFVLATHADIASRSPGSRSRDVADANKPVARPDERSNGSGLGGDAAWGEYAKAIRRWEGIFGRPAPPPTDADGRLSPAFVEWMLGFPDGWTDILDFRRNTRIRILGAAVQVQCAEYIGRLIRA